MMWVYLFLSSCAVFTWPCALAAEEENKPDDPPYTFQREDVLLREEGGAVGQLLEGEEDPSSVLFAGLAGTALVLLFVFWAKKKLADRQESDSPDPEPVVEKDAEGGCVERLVGGQRVVEIGLPKLYDASGQLLTGPQEKEKEYRLAQFIEDLATSLATDQGRQAMVSFFKKIGKQARKCHMDHFGFNFDGRTGQHHYGFTLTSRFTQQQAQSAKNTRQETWLSSSFLGNDTSFKCYLDKAREKNEQHVAFRSQSGTLLLVPVEETIYPTALQLVENASSQTLLTLAVQLQQEVSGLLRSGVQVENIAFHAGQDHGQGVPYVHLRVECSGDGRDFVKSHYHYVGRGEACRVKGCAGQGKCQEFG